MPKEKTKPTIFVIASGDGYVFDPDTLEMTTDVKDALKMGETAAEQIKAALEEKGLLADIQPFIEEPTEEELAAKEAEEKTKEDEEEKAAKDLSQKQSDWIRSQTVTVDPVKVAKLRMKGDYFPIEFDTNRAIMLFHVANSKKKATPKNVIAFVNEHLSE